MKVIQSMVRAASLACVIGAAQAAVVTIPQTALGSSPGVYTAGGYYTDNLGPNIVTTGGGHAANVGQANGRNDDGFMQLNLGFNFTLYGTTYSSLFINNNGNVSFGSGISAYVPTGPTGANAPLISPYFSDVDTTNPSSGVVHYNLSANQLVVTWDNVGYYNSHATTLNSFQLVLRADSSNVPAGEGLIGFFYENMDWELTDTSQTAAIGFGDGQGNGEVLNGSLLSGLNSVVAYKYLWFDANLNVVPPSGVPEPGSLALVALAIVAAAAAARGTRRC